MARKEKIIAALALALYPIIGLALFIASTFFYSQYVEYYNVPGKSYKNPETYNIKYKVTIPKESKYVNHWEYMIFYTESQGIAEFRIDEECDLTCFQTYEFTHKYDEGMEIFINDLIDIINRKFKNQDEEIEIFQEYLDYIRTHDAYVQRGKVISYGLYYPDDNKVIILFLQ